MRGILAFFEKELKEFFRSREAMFWTFLFPIIFALLFSAVFGSSSHVATANVGYIPEAGENNISAAYIEAMKNVSINGTRVFHMSMYENLTEGMEDLKSGRIEALLAFDDNFTENISTGFSGKIFMYYNTADPNDYQIVKGMLDAFNIEFSEGVQERRINITLSLMDKYMKNQTNITFPANMTGEDFDKYMRLWMESLSRPIEVEEKGISTEKNGAILWYTTAAIGVTFMFSGMISSASSIATERERGQTRRLATTRTKPWEMLVGKMLAILVILYISAFLIIIVMWASFGQFLEISPLIFGMLTIGALSTISLGLIISSLTKTAKAAGAATNAIAWPISFITGIFFPASLLPEWMRIIGDIFPTSALLRGIRLITIYHRPIGEYTYPIIASVIMTFVFLIIGSVAFKWRNEKE